MGEYAFYKGKEIKIGTCEDMYYLRADQVHLIQRKAGSFDPTSVQDAEAIRFRFPFPNEDNSNPGSFNEHNFGLGLHDIEPPEGVDHSKIQFLSNHPVDGMLISLPCPFSTEGKESKNKVGFNGFSGPVKITQQKLFQGKLVLVCRCGGCGAAWRIETVEGVKPIIAALNERAAKEDHRAWVCEQHHKTKIASHGDLYREIVLRILAGYTEPNYWSNLPNR